MQHKTHKNYNVSVHFNVTIKQYMILGLILFAKSVFSVSSLVSGEDALIIWSLVVR